MYRYACGSSTCAGGTYDFLVAQTRCPTCGGALTLAYRYDRLFGPAPTGALGDADNAKAQQRLEHEFRSRTFRKTDHIPSFGFGRFDAVCRAGEGVIEIAVKMHLNFSDEKIGTGLPGWTATERDDWRRNAMTAIGAVWDREAQWRLRRPGWAEIRVEPIFKLDFVDLPQESYVNATVFKVPQPTAQQHIWDVGRNGLMQDQYDKGPYSITRANLSQIAPLFRDDAPTGAQQHNILAHEFGHMIGLPDEYDDEDPRGSGPGWRQAGNVGLMQRFGVPVPVFGVHTDSLMSDGRRLARRHFVTVWEVLAEMTRDHVHEQEWELVRP